MCTNKMKKAVLAMVLLVSLVMTMPGVVHATTVTAPVTGVYGPHTVYVRKSGNTTLLGTMKLTRSFTSNVKVVHKTAFTVKFASCNSVSVYASYKDGDYASDTVSASLKVDDVVKISKTKNYADETKAEKSKTYGYCKVTY